MFRKPKITFNNYGVWRVATEGDIEGRTIRVIGTYLGDLTDIAQRLMQSWSLDFTYLGSKGEYNHMYNMLPAIIPDRESVNVRVTGMSKYELISELNKIEGVIASESNIYEAVKLRVVKEKEADLKKEKVVTKKEQPVTKQDPSKLQEDNELLLDAVEYILSAYEQNLLKDLKQGDLYHKLLKTIVKKVKG